MFIEKRLGNLTELAFTGICVQLIKLPLGYGIRIDWTALGYRCDFKICECWMLFDVEQ